jgi:hypothetical protein
MAKGQSTPDVRVRRRGARERSSTSGRSARLSLSQAILPATALDSAKSHPLERMLEGERGRLADAQSVLGCLHVALLHADESRIRTDPDYASAAAIALALIKQTAERLDAAIVRPLLRTVGTGHARRKSASPRS